MVMMKTVEERLQTIMWSRFWGNRCTLFTASSPVPACGGWKACMHSHVLPSQILTVASLEAVIT